MARALFVYGTLRDRDMLFAVLGHALSASAMIEAVATNHRAAFYPGRIYPALALSSGARAEGLLLYNLSPADLAALDAYEGEEYQRSIIAVDSGNATQIADVYWPVAGIPEEAPDWSLDQWVLNHKAQMLAVESANAEERRKTPGPPPQG